MAVLYALHRVTLPSFAAAVYNAGIIVCAIALARPFGVTGLVIGLLVGAAAQLTLQLVGLRGRLPRLSLDLTQPAVRRIMRLYAPVAAGLVVSALVVVLDTRLASLTGDASLAAMRFATQVVQLPLGLVATALSFAVLPVLSRYGAAGAADRGFRDTLALGIKAALFLIAPLSIALLTLRDPIVALLFRRGAFGADDVVITSRALFFYAPQLPFVAVDQLLIAAFYALQNTRLPVIAGVVCAFIYAAVATLTLEPMGMAGLVLANTIQNSAHAVILLAVLARRHAAAVPPGLAGVTTRIAIASALMALVCVLVQNLAPAPAQPLPAAAYLLIVGAVAGGVYLVTLLALRGEEVALARVAVLDRLRAKRGA
jgi:putative peptidoglycan lipid II flippase